jgi:hypothetical protein
LGYVLDGGESKEREAAVFPIMDLLSARRRALRRAGLFPSARGIYLAFLDSDDI